MKCRSRTRRHSGFTLVESLIALVLLSLGLLGAAAMLLGGLQAHAEALRRLNAMNLVRDMADRIRANPHAGAAYDSGTAQAPSAGCNGGVSCLAEHRASADLANFANAARTLFPGTATFASVEFEPAIGPADTDRYAISLRWRGPRDAVSNTVALPLLAAPVAGGA